MTQRQAGSAGLRREAHLTFRFSDVADLSALVPNPPHRDRPRRRRPTPVEVVTSILADAARAASSHSAVVVAVPPAVAGDAALLFLRSGGQTYVMLGVPSQVIRSPRLRGEGQSRDRNAERQWEYMRVAESPVNYETDGVDDTDET